MRIIGQLKEEANANIFGDYLFINDIDNEVRKGTDGTWEIWVMDEDKIDDAESKLKDFIKNPDNTKYKESVQTALKKRDQFHKENKKYDKRQMSSGTVLKGLRGQHFVLKSVTGFLVSLSVLVTLIWFLDRENFIISKLFISEFKLKIRELQNILIYGLPEIRKGQVWRLITPIFLHFSLMHIIFNMMWLMDLGSLIEKKQGPLFIAVLIIVIAVLSNFSQYLVSGPTFGGMSGVVYGLLGYVWIRGKFDPLSGYFLHKHTVIMMIVWFFLCMTGIIGNVANTAHGVGLVIGMIWGYLLAKLRNRN